MKYKYKQCILRKGNIQTTSWIPEKYAKVNKVLKLKAVDGWKVIEVGVEMDEKEVNERSRDYLKQRKASDV